MCFFFNDTATTEIYTLSLHDALPISNYLVYGMLPTAAVTRLGAAANQSIYGGAQSDVLSGLGGNDRLIGNGGDDRLTGDRKSTRLNSSHANISYAVFCLKTKKY